MKMLVVVIIVVVTKVVCVLPVCVVEVNSVVLSIEKPETFILLAKEACLTALFVKVRF